jgi:DNA transposition AAA+ family ATPase
MKEKVVPIKNVVMLRALLAELKVGHKSIPKLAIVEGVTGTGKTTALEDAAVDHNAVFVRVTAVDTIASLLEAICFELGLDGGRRNSDRLRWIRDSLKENPRPIFVDEADALCHNARMLEVLRDIHDLAGVPVVLIGMDGIRRKLKRHPQFERRISQRIDFHACDLEDAGLLARELCEVEVAPDLVAKMHRRANGSVGKITVALAHFERFARGHRWKAINAEQWGDKPMFLGDKAVS